MSRRTVLFCALVAALFVMGACQRTPPASSRTGSASRAVDDSNSALERATAGGRIESYYDVVDRAAPAVVTIRSARHVRSSQQNPFLEDPFLRRFFGDQMPQGGRGELQQALGSGV